MLMLNIFCEQFDFSPLAEAFEGEIESDCGLSAEIIITDEAEIRRLNAEARGIDAVTDVLSFPSLDGIRGRALKKADFPFEVDEEGNIFLGSIVICEKRAREQAEEYGHSRERELGFLVAHSMLHLIGYDHMEEEERAIMEQRQREILEGIGLKR